MAYSHDSYHDDPEHLEEPNRRKNTSSFFALVALVIGGGFFLQTTLAANISLSAGAPVEFGQGTLQTTACSGDTQLTLTPTSAFTNAAGAGAFKFSSVTVSGIPDGCWEKDFTISAYGASDNTPLTLFNSESTSAVIYNNAGTFEAGLGTTGFSVSGNSGTFTVVFDTPVALSSSVFNITMQSGAHTLLACADGGACVTGNRGPGGGIVYYVSSATFASPGSTCNTNGVGGISTCKHLEAALGSWYDPDSLDPIYQWSSNMTLLTGQDLTTAGSESGFANEKYNWKIGQGFYNTSVMKVSGASSLAQAAVLAFAGGPGSNSTIGQWFIPSMNELNELCKHARGQITGDLTVACITGSGTFKSTANVGGDLGGFATGFYLSSSERAESTAKGQAFTNGTQSHANKDASNRIRPVRAF